VEEDTQNLEEESQKEVKKVVAQVAWKKLPLKVKLIIVGILAGVIFVAVFVVIIIAVLISTGIIDTDDIGNTNAGSDREYTNVIDTTTYAWPIGGTETETINGVTYSTGEVAGTTITSRYAGRPDPFTGEPSTHHGIDIASSDGSTGKINITAAKAGTVIYPSKTDKIDCPYSAGPIDYQCGSGYGNYVMIEHDDGAVTVYAHLQENTIIVRKGDTVVAGQVLGKMGSSGRSTGPHLHFEVRINGQTVDPENYISLNVDDVVSE